MLFKLKFRNMRIPVYSYLDRLFVVYLECFTPCRSIYILLIWFSCVSFRFPLELNSIQFQVFTIPSSSFFGCVCVWFLLSFWLDFLFTLSLMSIHLLLCNRRYNCLSCEIYGHYFQSHSPFIQSQYIFEIGDDAFEKNGCNLFKT